MVKNKNVGYLSACGYSVFVPSVWNNVATTVRCSEIGMM